MYELVGTYVAFLILGAHAVTLEHSKLTVEEQITKALDAVALPVFNQSLELLDSFDTFFAGYCVVCSSKYRRCCLDTSYKILLSLIVKVAVLLQLLRLLALVTLIVKREAHREQQRVLGQPLERLEQEGGE